MMMMIKYQTTSLQVVTLLQDVRNTHVYLIPAHIPLKFKTVIFFKPDHKYLKPHVTPQTSYHTTNPSRSGTILPVKTKAGWVIFPDMKQTIADDVQDAPLPGV